MNKFLFEYMSGFKEQIKIEIEDNKKYIYSLEDEIRHEVSKSTQFINNVQRQCSAFHTEHILETKIKAN